MNHLQAFLYLLARDEVVPGAINRIIQEIEKNADNGFNFTDQELAAWAEAKAKRLLGQKNFSEERP